MKFDSTLSQWARDLKFNADQNPNAINALGKTVPVGLLAAIAMRSAAQALQAIQAAPDRELAIDAELAKLGLMIEAMDRAIDAGKGINAALAAAEGAST